MKNKIILDTNFLYAIYNKSDSCHEKATYKFSTFEFNQEFIVPQIVVAELIASGSSLDFVKLSREFASKFTAISDLDLEFINTISSAKRRKLKAIDCLILAMCKRFNAKLLTFDENLLKSYTSIFEK